MVTRLKKEIWSYLIRYELTLLLLTASVIIQTSSAHTFPFPASIPKNKNISYSRNTFGLQDLVLADLKIAALLQQEVNKLPAESYLKRSSEIYLKDVLSGNGIGSLDNDITETFWKVVNNPIASYRTIRRMVTLFWDLSLHAKGVLDIPNEEVTEYLSEGLPDEKDWMHAMDGILRLHSIYDFNIQQLANGEISGVSTGAKLDAVHCYEIGVYGMHQDEYFSHAVDWLELALHKVTMTEDKTIGKGIVVHEFKKAISKHDKALAKGKGYDHFFFDQTIASMMKNGEFSNRKSRRKVMYDNWAGKKGLTEATPNYWGLCGGNNYQSEEEKSELFCWLEFKAHAQFLIGPMKMEFLSRSPDVVQMYDVIGEQMINKMVLDSEEILSPSVVVDTEAGEDEGPKSLEMNLRTSENGWINDIVYTKEYVRLEKTISHLTGLEAERLTAAESIQVAAYTTSGHYEVHFDAGLPRAHCTGWGDRIATFMIYLSDVEMGGYTVFPHVGMGARPVKGSAVFWYNVFREEKYDPLTLHGGCPVIMGQKYVANKWIHYYDQFHTHKCSPKMLERFQIAVNKNYVPSLRSDSPQDPNQENQNGNHIRQSGYTFYF